MHRIRNRERGNTMVLSLVVLAALAALSGLTVVSVQGSGSTSTSDHAHLIATYAAESGAASAMDFMRTQIDWTTGWSAFVSPSNTAIQIPVFPGNGTLPGQTDNPFSIGQQAWYSVEVLNNRSDPGHGAGVDTDFRIVLRSTGHGPNAAVAVVEWEIAAEAPGIPLTLLGWRVVL